MSDNPAVSNSYIDSLPSFRPRGIEKTLVDGTEVIVQVVAIDWGGSGAESLTPIITTTETAYINYIDDVSASVSYYGKALPGTATSAASWQIIKKNVSGSVTSYLYASSAATFINVWDNRASLSYS